MSIYKHIIIVTGNMISYSYISGPNFVMVNNSVRFEVNADPLV